MEKLFIESAGFTARISRFLSEENYSNLQNLLLANADLGKVMPGCGGMRKLRVADSKRAKGKRGGFRVVYLHVPEVDLIFLVDIYDKRTQATLTADQKKRLEMLASAFKREAIANYRGPDGGT